MADRDLQAPAATCGGFAFALALRAESPPTNHPIAILGSESKPGITHLNRLLKNLSDCHPEESAILIGGRRRIPAVA
jgi:hypothetical protein